MTSDRSQRNSHQIYPAMNIWTYPPKPIAKPDSALIEELTARETEILRMVATGMSNQEIADQLVVSERTIRTHVSNILSKLLVENRTQATLVALDSGLADGRIAKAYISRNGDLDPPSSVGAFWAMWAEPSITCDLVVIANSPWGEWRMRRTNGEWEPYLPHRLRMDGVRWWGPIETPWDELS